MDNKTIALELIKLMADSINKQDFPKTFIEILNKLNENDNKPSK